MNDGLKIISLPVDQGGCGWYRVRQPFEMIKQYTTSDPYIVDQEKDNPMAIYEALKIANVGLMRQGAEQGWRMLKNKYPEIVRKWVMDIDDNIEIISPYSEHYSEYGLEEFYDNNSKVWIWKDKQTFDIEKNRQRVNSLIEGLKEVDLVTVTTKKLADYAKQYNKNVAILPNMVNLDLWWKLDLKPNKQLRIGWSGGISHYEDWYSIKKPLNELMRKYQFKLVMAGSHFEGIIDEDNRHLVEVMSWLPFKGHSYRMMCMSLDIALIPLADLPFNHYKSSIKWYEMSAMGVPSIVSNIIPYSEDIEHNKTALGYKDEKQFYDSLVSLIENEQLRKKIGFNARKWVEQNRDARKNAKMWIDAYKTIL